MQVPDLIRKYPFTGAAEAVVGALLRWRDGPERRLDASERRWASEVRV